MKAIQHASVWGDVTATLRTRAVMTGNIAASQKRAAALISAMAEFTEIVAAAYREEAERDGE